LRHNKLISIRGSLSVYQNLWLLRQLNGFYGHKGRKAVKRRLLRSVKAVKIRYWRKNPQEYLWLFTGFAGTIGIYSCKLTAKKYKNNFYGLPMSKSAFFLTLVT